jgi:long-chain acyl-CoA synthetase
VVSFNPPEATRPGSIGVPIPGVEVQVWNDDGSVLPAGEVGELMTRGPNVMKGYLNFPEATARAITKDGWLHTGDLARLDEDGYIFITGRKKELIISSGKNIYPLEVEQAINELDAVAESAVIGIDDEMRGEYPKAYVVLNDGAQCTVKEVREHCIARLAQYMVPREVEFIDELPKNALNKVQKHRLKEMAAKG